jgi:putative endonuclease
LDYPLFTVKLSVQNLLQMNFEGRVYMNRKELGRWGEKMAAQYLIRKKRFDIIEYNYRCPIGEIDLVAHHNNILVFIEVKTRRSLAFGFPAESVNKIKQRKYVQLAQYYTKENGLTYADCRFDVVEVFVKHNGSCQFNHICNAF